MKDKKKAKNTVKIDRLKKLMFKKFRQFRIEGNYEE